LEQGGQTRNMGGGALVIGWRGIQIDKSLWVYQEATRGPGQKTTLGPDHRRGKARKRQKNFF